MRRGDVVWMDFGIPRGSAPGYWRPVVIVQSDTFTNSALATVIVAVVTSNLTLARMPGNVFVSASASGLSKDSVVNVTQMATVDRASLDEAAGQVPDYLMDDVDAGLQLVLGV